ncbi:MAG TPA: TerC/Alx family metal homeostasis membrane protein [Candidatus Acidoferrales bacterium]|nr:TerC/Alx family metal homeostasis membrane protein [Candidatus Acidoferrales bacterium]
MGTWPLWIAFNAGVLILLLLDLGLFQRRPHTISLKEAALESAGWIALSLGFGAWIFFVYGRGPGLEFFAGYVVEKSLSMDNIFVFLLIFQYFRVEPRYQHRLLFWGVLGALVLRGVMVGAGAALISRFDWILYILGAFLLYSGFKLFGADHAVHPEKNPVVRWAQKFLPMTDTESGQALLVRQAGRWLFTPFFLVVIVLETTDLLLAVDSVAAVFGVTRDPFLVYSSNVCAILGLRALYFLLAGVMQYFQYLDEGLAVTVMFIGAKMLANPWVHISTGLSLGIVGGIIALAILISVLRTKPPAKEVESTASKRGALRVFSVTPESIGRLATSDAAERAQIALDLFVAGSARVRGALKVWETDGEFQGLIVREKVASLPPGRSAPPKLTVGIAVRPETFEKIRAANSSAPLADAPSDQDVLEFELEFRQTGTAVVRLDILTAMTPGGTGAIARFLEKFGEGIQQVEIDVTDVDRATQILRTRFQVEPVYPSTRAGANGTRVNFFLVAAQNNQKLLVELVEQPKGTHQSTVTSH